MNTYRELVIQPMREELAEVDAKLAKWADRRLMRRRAELIVALHRAEAEEQHARKVWARRYDEAMDDPTGQDLDRLLED